MRLYFAMLIMSLFLIAGCANDADLQSESCSVAGTCNTIKESVYKAEEIPRAVPVDKLEIYHFHGKDQCYSCKTVGAYAEETVGTYFKDELDSGKIVFGHINIELIENRELVVKYQVQGSSLWLGVYDSEGFHPEENVNVWYKIKDKKDYMIYLKGLIEKRLAGDYS